MSHLALALEQAKAVARDVVDEVSADLVARLEAVEAKLDSFLNPESGVARPTDGDSPAPAAKAPRARAPRRAGKGPAPADTEADLPTADTDAPE